METYYYKFYDRKFFEPYLVSLVQRPTAGVEYDNSIPFIQVNQSDRFSHLLEILADFDVVQFQGGFNPLVCEVSRYIKKPHLLLEVLHNIEPGGMYPEINGTVCVSNAVAAKQAKHYDSRTILNGLDLDIFSFSPKCSAATDKIVLLQVARRSKMAINLDELSEELFALNPNMELWIVGESAQHSDERIKCFGLTENIGDLYKAAHFTVLLSKEEPFGLVAIESMASGTPVIASASGGILDIITDSSLGFLVEGPTKENALNVIKSAIDSIGTQRYFDLSQNGRIHIERNFCIKDCVKKYEKYIFDLYQAERLNSLERVQPNYIPPYALVCEIIMDMNQNDFGAMVTKFQKLILCPEKIENAAVLQTAVGLAAKLKRIRPELFPRLLALYLYNCGDRSEFTCQEAVLDVDYIREIEGIT